MSFDVWTSVSRRGEVVKLVRLTLEDLGLPQEATYDQIVSKAEKLGLKCCPFWAGPALREKYTDQQDGEWVKVFVNTPSIEEVAPEELLGADYNTEIFELFAEWTPWGKWDRDIVASPRPPDGGAGEYDEQTVLVFSL